LRTASAFRRPSSLSGELRLPFMDLTQCVGFLKEVGMGAILTFFCVMPRFLPFK
jgi:hypothetical protein